MKIKNVLFVMFALMPVISLASAAQNSASRGFSNKITDYMIPDSTGQGWVADELGDFVFIKATSSFQAQELHDFMKRKAKDEVEAVNIWKSGARFYLTESYRIEAGNAKKENNQLRVEAGNAKKENADLKSQLAALKNASATACKAPARIPITLNAAGAAALQAISALQTTPSVKK